MFKFCSLYSGSSGNSLFVQTDNTKILIDAGESAKKIETALNSIDVDINEIDAVLVTHEHTDHIKGLATISKNSTYQYMQIKKHGKQCHKWQKKHKIKICLM